jgi:hypothetical protein
MALIGAKFVAVVLAAAAGASSCQPASGPAGTAAATAAGGSGGAPVSVPAATGGSATAALAKLAVKGRAANTGYSREQFGPEWADVDRNGCDTRNDVLRRDLSAESLEPNGCVVTRGQLHDPYSGATVAFARGVSSSSEVQIDHMVALQDAWVKGAARWDAAKRGALANDPLNLQATVGAINEGKGSGDAATWLPPQTGYRCTYVARQIAVKQRYGLWVTQAEHDAMAGILARCPSQQLPTAASLAPPKIGAGGTGKPAAGSTAAGSTAAPGSDPRFPSCKAVKAAGLGPYLRGRDPEYAWYTDGDGDGKVCD